MEIRNGDSVLEQLVRCNQQLHHHYVITRRRRRRSGEGDGEVHQEDAVPGNYTRSALALRARAVLICSTS